MDSLDILRDRILNFRAKHDLSQTEFAQMCKLTRPTIGVIESGRFRKGRHGVSKLTIAKIINVLEEGKASEE